jgi:hypothetical protein
VPPAECFRLLRPFLHRDGVFLQIGSGTASLARAVAGQVRFAYGTDLGPPADDDAGPPNFERLHARRGYIPLGDERVSLAFDDLSAVDLGPVDLTRHLREVCRVLVPGGTYVFRPAAPDESATGYQGAYTFGELADQARAAGFATVGLRVRVGGWSLPVPIWTARVAGAFLGCLSVPARRWLDRTALIRGVSDPVVVAWKDSRCLVHDGLPAAPRYGLI